MTVLGFNSGRYDLQLIKMYLEEPRIVYRCWSCQKKKKNLANRKFQVHRCCEFFSLEG